MFEVIERAFSEWPGRLPSTFEAWHSHWLARSDFDPSLMLLAEDARGELVGALYAMYFPSEGWVLAVEAAIDGAASHDRSWPRRSASSRAVVFRA